MTPAITNETTIGRTVSALQPLRYSVLTLLCGALLVAGFFLAARQHFSSMDYSIRNSRLRKQLDELEAEKRRLLLAKEISLSPVELMKSAKRIGYRDTAGLTPVDPAMRPSPASATRSDAASLIVRKTVISKPVEAPAAIKTEKYGREKKTETAPRNKKSQTAF